MQKWNLSEAAVASDAVVSDVEAHISLAFSTGRLDLSYRGMFAHYTWPFHELCSIGSTCLGLCSSAVYGSNPWSSGRMVAQKLMFEDFRHIPENVCGQKYLNFSDAILWHINSSPNVMSSIKQVPYQIYLYPKPWAFMLVCLFYSIFRTWGGAIASIPNCWSCRSLPSWK